MPTCFVIQPFDAGKFDKRFDDVFAPAIKAAGLEPYRVDRDPKVDVPIDAIEEGIRAAALCLAYHTGQKPRRADRAAEGAGDGGEEQPDGEPVLRAAGAVARAGLMPRP
jgi:hypothetical protein